MIIKPGLIHVDRTSGDISKVIQLDINDEPILAAGDRNSSNHGIILDRILDQMEVPYEKVRLFDDTVHANKTGELYKVAGMGYARFFHDEKLIFLYGFSTGYVCEMQNSLGIDKDHIKRLQPHIPGFEIITE